MVLRSDRNWQAVTAAFEKARTLPVEQRQAFLIEFCAGDDEVRRETESLLASYDSSGGFLESPALERSAAQVLASGGGVIGSRLGAYRITRPIVRSGPNSITRISPAF